MLRGSLKLGRILGIPVYIHITFLLLLGLLVGLSASGGAPADRVFSGFLFMVSMFACVLAHEFGHALMARRFGIQTLDITLLPIGGVARLQRMPEKPTEELLVAIAGPAVNVVIAAGLFGVLVLNGNTERMLHPDIASLSLAAQVMIGNISLLLFNLVPAFPMDGGRVLRALLAYVLPYTQATQIAAGIGQTLAVLVGLGVLFTQGYFFSQHYILLLIAVFVWFGARQEAAHVLARARLSTLRVEDALLTELRLLPSTARLGHALQLLSHSAQRAIPVLDESGFYGVASANAVLQAVQNSGPNASILQATQRDLLHVAVDQPLNLALQQMQESNRELAVVIKDGAFAGMLDAEHAQRVLAVQNAATATAQTPGSKPTPQHKPDYIFPPLR